MTSSSVTYIAHASASGYNSSIFHRLKTKHPRKELMDLYYTKHADKMMIDTAKGVKHIGYVVRGHWFTLYKIEGMGL